MPAFQFYPVLSSISTVLLALGFCSCVHAPGSKVQRGSAAPAQEVPFGYLDEACTFRGAAPFDVSLRRGSLIDSAAVDDKVGSLVVAVTDLRTAKPLAGGVVLLDGGQAARSVRDTLATGSGWLTLNNVRAGKGTVSVRRVGYVAIQGPVLIRAGRIDTLMVALNAFGNVHGDLGC